MRGLGILAGLAALAVGGPHHMGRTRYPAGHKPSGYRFRFDKGERATARRLRQQERDRRNQEARAANDFGCQVEGVTRLSRRGRYIREATA